MSVNDDVVVSSPQVVEWFLHSDVLIAQDNRAFVIGGDRGLRVTLDGLAVQTEIQPTALVAPGQPGSITKGQEERRGYHLRIRSSPLTAARLSMRLRLMK